MKTAKMILIGCALAFGANQKIELTPLAKSILMSNLTLETSSPKIWIDTATWCQYLVFPQNTNPRLDANGNPICLNLDSLKSIIINPKL